jgi:hypothetical protein
VLVLLKRGRYAGAVGSRVVTRVERRARVAVQKRMQGRVIALRSDPTWFREAFRMGSVVKKRRKRMAKKKHRKLLRKTRVQRRRLGK